MSSDVVGKHMISRKVINIYFRLLLVLAFCSITFYEANLPAEVEVSYRLDDSRIERIISNRGNDLFVVLKNGVTALIRESHASKVVTCQVLIKTGSVYEGKYTGGGLSHYLEHVVSGGSTSRFTEEEAKLKLEEMGGASNAYTTYDHTGYYIKTTRSHVNDALSMLISYVTACKFEPTECEREKQVILEEFQLRDNYPSRQLWSLFMKMAYLAHPVRYPVIGEKEIFIKTDRNDLVDYYRTWYTPQNMVITVVGDVDKEKTLNDILDLAGLLQRAAGSPPVVSTETPQLAYRYGERVSLQARLARIQMGFRTVRLTHPDLYPLDVLALILGEGRTSRLYQTVCDKMGLALEIDAFSWTPPFVEGQLLLSMTLSGQNNVEKVIDAVLKELSVIKDRSVGVDELERAKRRVVAQYIFDSQSTENQARQLATDWISTGDPYFSDKYVDRIKKVTRSDIQRVAQKYLRNDRLTVAVLKPSVPKVISQKIPSRPRPTLQVQKRVLSNRMTLLLKQNPAFPIVTLKLFSRGGLRFDPPDKPGLCHFMTSLLTKGTRNRSKFEIAKTLEDLGGSINSNSGENTLAVSVTVLKKDFDIALNLLADVVLNPTFPLDEIEKQRRDTLLAIKRLNEDWITEVIRLFKKHYFRRHPYRNDILGTAKSVREFSQAEIRELYRSIIMPNNTVLAVYGDIDPDSVIKKVERAFSDFQPRILEQPIIENETEVIDDDVIFETLTDKTSAAIFVGYNGLTVFDPDRPVLDVIDAIVSGIGYPSGWLHDALRGGDRSLVYYVHAYPHYGIDGGYFGIIAQTTPDHLDRVQKIILEKMALIQDEEVDEATLNRAKGICITMHQINLEINGAQASSDAINEVMGLGYDYDQKYPDLIRRVTANDVKRVAQRLFKHHLIVITRPEKDTR